ncbi:MAG: AAA family ATPase [Desulfuromonadales bacterium]|nr:AAA family ATPase [Desulfuromonadales bacterium]
MVRTKFPQPRHRPSQQRLQALRVIKLKNLNNVDIEFAEDGLTAILGPNGFGKSTVLHALAATFSPLHTGEGQDKRFVDFFPNTPHGVWMGSVFVVAHKFSLGAEKKTIATLVQKMTGQWYPIAKSRPVRETYFIGVKSAVPKIEVQGTRRRLQYSTEELSDDTSLEIRGKAGFVFNRDYTKYHSNQVSSRRNFIGVEYRGVNFSALAMGAGEQRVFEILSTVIKAKKYALILIDEIDLLLHTDALARLMNVLDDYAKKKNLQIIFTTHREAILDFEEFIAVRHLYQANVTPHRTFCFNETRPDAISRLTGQPNRPLAVACEDDVSTAIIEKVAIQAKVRKYTEITRFGAAINCFTLIAALMLNGDDLSNSIFVIDGDVYETDEKKAERVDEVLTGNHPADVKRREDAPYYVRQFSPVTKLPPEQVLHSLVCTVPSTGDSEIDDVITAAQNVTVVANSHDYVDKIIETLGTSREVGMSRIVNVAAKADGWNDYVASIREWFEEKHDHVVETVAQ